MSWHHQSSDFLTLRHHYLWKVAKPAPGSFLTRAM
jgi:hypothetical protein